MSPILVVLPRHFLSTSQQLSDLHWETPWSSTQRLSDPHTRNLSPGRPLRTSAPQLFSLGAPRSTDSTTSRTYAQPLGPTLIPCSNRASPPRPGFRSKLLESPATRSTSTSHSNLHELRSSVHSPDQAPWSSFASLHRLDPSWLQPRYQTLVSRRPPWFPPSRRQSLGSQPRRPPMRPRRFSGRPRLAVGQLAVGFCSCFLFLFLFLKKNKILT